MSYPKRRIPLILCLIMALNSPTAVPLMNPPAPNTEDFIESYMLYFAQLADGDGYTTQFLLVNPSEVEVSGTLDLFQSDGTPMTIVLNGNRGSTFPITIKPHGTLILKSSGESSPIQTGWARVQTGVAIGGSLIYSYSSGGKLISEAGLDPSVPTDSFRLSVDTRNGYMAGLALANPSATAINLTLTLNDAEGRQLAQTKLPLGSKRHFAKLVNEFFPDQNLNNFKGVIQVSATDGEVFGTTLRFDPDLSSLASIPVIDTKDNPESYNLYFPQIADGSGYRTVFSIVNPNSAALSADLELFHQDGTPLALKINEQSGSSHVSAIPANGTVFLETAGDASSVQVGWARVRANGPIGGSVVYVYQSGGKTLAEAGINPAIPAKEFVLPIDRRGGIQAGLAVANPSSGSSMTVSLSLHAADGSLVGLPAVRELDGQRQFAVLLDELFPTLSLNDFIGSLVVKSSAGDMAGTTLRFNQEVTILSSLPVTPTPSAAATSTTTSTSVVSTSLIDTTITTSSLIATSTTSTNSTLSSTTSSTSSTTTSTTLVIRIVGNLDQPAGGSSFYDSFSVSGWAMASTGVNAIDVLVDDVVLGRANYGQSRPDICGAVPGYPNCGNSGYQYSLNPAGLSLGSHRLQVRVTAVGGVSALHPSTPITFNKVVQPTTSTTSTTSTSSTIRVTTTTLGGNPTAGQIYQIDDIVGNLRFVPAGTFTQGSPTTEVGRTEGEGVQFVHTLTKNLAVMEMEVSRKMWTDLRAVQPSLPVDPSNTTLSPNAANPVQNVTWHEAVLFANLLSIRQGFTRAYYKDAAFTQPVDATNYNTGDFYCNFNTTGYRLPSEGEWEYSTRAGTTGPFSIAEPAYNSTTSNSCTAGTLAALESVAWFCANWGQKYGLVGSKASNPWGLKDVHGNVVEWCWDWWDSGQHSALPQTDYRGQATGSPWTQNLRVIRGGITKSPSHIRSAMRWAYLPTRRETSNGFRLVRSLTIITQWAAGQLYAVDSIVRNLRYVPKGTYTQGSPTTEACRGNNEGPSQKTLSKNLVVMETEVTREMWNDLRGWQNRLPADPTDASKSSGLSDPAQNVSWDQAVLFAQLLSTQQGLSGDYAYRLPTEAEWEYFARAGATGPFSIVEPAYNASTCSSCTAGTLKQLESVAWFCANAGDKTHPAGTKSPNAWGLRDIHGNVAEMVSDLYENHGYLDVLFKGGSANINNLSSPKFLRFSATNKDSYAPVTSYGVPGVGFRLVRSVD